MNSTVRTRKLRIAGAFCAAASLLASCATPPPPKVVEAAPPSVTLPAKLVDAAAVYAAYVDRASAVTPEFTDGAMVADKLQASAAYEPVQFQRGMGAYGAIVALQDPAFVAGVRAYTRDPAARTQLVIDIMKDPAYVVGIKGSDSAAGLIVGAFGTQGSGVRSAGEKVRQAAYDVQRQAWSKAPVANRDSRLAAVKSLSTTPLAASMEDSAKLKMASSGQAPLPFSGAPQPPPYTPIVVRSLAVAALAVLGEGVEANSATLWAVLEEPNQGLCLSMAKLNVNQCLAVAKPYYEDVFCLGVHVLMDTGSCVMKGAGASRAAPALIASATPARPAAVEMSVAPSLKAQ